MRTFKEILRDVVNSCNNVFYGGCNGIHASVVEAAAKIYVAELQKEQIKK